MVLNKLIALFCEILGVDEDEITETTEFTEDFEIERIDLVKLIIAAEDTFDITIHDEDVASFKNVSDIAHYIEETLGSY